MLKDLPACYLLCWVLNGVVGLLRPVACSHWYEITLGAARGTG
jgi:hypothetical protein